MNHLGIDPGASGALAVIGDDGAYAEPFKNATEKDIADMFRDAAAQGPCFAIIEKVGAMPGNGGVSMFNFGKNYGFLRSCLFNNDIPFEDVQPKAWQAPHAIPIALRGKKADSKAVASRKKTARKNHLKAKAQQLFPEIKITHDNADALLIAEHCRRARGES